MRAALGRFGPQGGMPAVVERWPGAVGPQIARFAWPARISRDGTVHVNTADSVWAFELGHRGSEIAARLEVQRVRFVPGPLPEAELAPPARALRPSAEDVRRAAAIAAAIGDEKLRGSVQKAVSFSLARARSDHRF